MKLLNGSRERSEQVPVGVPHLVISIYDPGSPLPRLVADPTRLDRLFVAFHDLRDRDCDIVKDAIETGVLVPFTVEMATRLWRFVEEDESGLSVRDGIPEAIAVYCEAGVSRSAAVCAALARAYCPEDEERWWTACAPNDRVYRLLCEQRKT